MSNKPFPGFPAVKHFTPLPSSFFSFLLPQIDNLTELKVILHIFWLLYQKRGYPKFVTYRELLGDKVLMPGIGDGNSPAEVLRAALELAVEQGILLYQTMERGGRQEELYFINTESNRKAVAKIQRGELSLGDALPVEEPYIKEESADIFTLYEQNIGLLTPLIAEELKEAEKLYPASWVEEAFKEAVGLNRRNWRYVSRILERWSAEGKESGGIRRDSKKETKPDKYFKGKYGHLVRR